MKRILEGNEEDEVDDDGDGEKGDKKKIKK